MKNQTKRFNRILSAALATVMLIAAVPLSPLFGASFNAQAKAADDSQYLTYYADVINNYKAVIKKNFYRDAGSRPSSLPKYVSEAMVYHRTNYNNSNKVFYALYDINQNGFPELLVGDVGDYGDAGYFIYGIYSYSNKVNIVADSSNWVGKTRGILFSNGTIVEKYTGSSRYQYWVFNQLNKNDQPVETDFILYEGGNYVRGWGEGAKELSEKKAQKLCKKRTGQSDLFGLETDVKPNWKKLNSLPKLSGLQKPTGLKVAATGTTALKLTWKKVNGAKGYEVYGKSASAKKYKLLKTVKSTSAKIEGLKADTAYQFKVRAFCKPTKKALFSSFSEKLTALTAASAADAGRWGNYPRNQLCRPNDSLLVEPYTATVYCIDVDVQDYVKMRLGPSKTYFEPVGLVIGNLENVTVKSKSVNGWTFCERYGTEGWIRSDFIFRDPGDIPVNLLPKTACSGRYMTKVSLNMRAEPRSSSKLVTTVPSGSWVRVEEKAPITNGWVRVHYVKYSDDYETIEAEYDGYVLYAYLRSPEGIGDKPVLYLYPEQTQDVNVKVSLAPNVQFGCTYPAYGNGWSVTAAPDGTLINHADGREYSYLFWDIVGTADYDFSHGFVVKGEDTAAFLQDTLDRMGLTPREANEFIVYWLPKMQNNPYNLISFQSEAYTDLVGLEITPKPDSLLRVFMAYKALEQPISVPAQTIAPFARTGFTAVEWGGAEVK